MTGVAVRCSCFVSFLTHFEPVTMNTGVPSHKRESGRDSSSSRRRRRRRHRCRRRFLLGDALGVALWDVALGHDRLELAVAVWALDAVVLVRGRRRQRREVDARLVGVRVVRVRVRVRVRV